MLPVIVAVLRVGDVSVLLVNVWEPVSVVTVESIATVKVLAAPVVSIPVPPAISNVSLSKSILNAPPESPWKSKSWLVIWSSTYVLIALALAKVSLEALTLVKSVSISVMVVDVPIIRPSMVAIPF